MKVKKVPITEAIGHILLHNQTDSNGRKLLKKGQNLTNDDLPKLQALGREQVYVAMFDPADIGENEAARRLGKIIAGPGIGTSSDTTGRVNLLAETAGVLKVSVNALVDFNSQPGITLGTLPTNTVVQPKTMVGTIKIIPYSVPRTELEAAEAIAAGGLVQLNPFVVKQATLITTGSEAARSKVINGFTTPLRNRLSAYGTEMAEGPYVPEDETAIAEALQEALTTNVGLALIAGETSVMDMDDITPRAIKAIGGQIVHHGVPVEPGNLLLLAYVGDTPIVGAPGCARSKNYNVVDIVLPRLAAGERLTRRDLVELGHGGLLK